MQIKFRCPCGVVHSADGALAGRRIQCTECQEIVYIPDLDGGPPRKAFSDRVTAEELPPRRRLATEIVEDQKEDQDRPIRTKKKKKRFVEKNENQGFFSTEHSVMNSGALGGVMAMIGAVVWFVVGFVYFDRIFFYPPILFVIGLVAVFRGNSE